MLAFDQFVGRFREELAAEFPGPITSDSTLFEELALDSFSAFRMILFLEELADVPFPPDEIPPMFTVGDAFEYYGSLCAYAHES